MEYEVTPQPSPEEGAALEAALERLSADEVPPAYRSAWRQAALRESTLPEGE